MGRFGFAQGLDDDLEPCGKYKSGAAIPSCDTVLAGRSMAGLTLTPMSELAATGGGAGRAGGLGCTLSYVAPFLR